jgi:hypothetical protein
MRECMDAVVGCAGSWWAALSEATARVNGGAAALVWERVWERDVRECVPFCHILTTVT